jgi:hypothetical protein
MCILQLTLGKLIYVNFSSVFCNFSVKHPDGLSLRPNGCSLDGRTILFYVRTCEALMAGR